MCYVRIGRHGIHPSTTSSIGSKEIDGIGVFITWLQQCINGNGSKTKATYNYGNLITTEFSSPFWYDFANTTTTSGGTRILSQSGDRSYGVILSGVVGVEYFIAPKISIGGEFRLGLYTGYDFKGYRTVERWTGTEREIETLPKDANDGRIAFRNASTGSLFMMFHF